MSSASVCIVILNWNGAEDTLACLDSLASLTYPSFNTIVVDNGSTDGSLERLRPYAAPYPLKLTDAGRNFGYAGGNNIGITFGLDQGSDYVLLLNNDTTVAPDFLEPLIEAMEATPQAAASQPKLYYQNDPDLLWCTGASFDDTNLEFVFENNKIRDDHHSFEQVVPVQVCVGAALMLRASVIRKIGVLDPDLFLMHEESDWCFRARKHGYTCLFVPRSHVWHKVSASLGVESPLMVYFGSRNLMRWGQRHLGLYGWARLLLRTFMRTFNLPPIKSIFLHQANSPLAHIKQIFWSAAHTVRKIRSCWRQPEYIARRMALRDYLLGRCGDCPARIRELQIWPRKSFDSHA